MDYFFIARISLNDLAEQERLSSPRYVSNHFSFDTSVFSPTLMFHCSASRDTSKQYSRAMSYDIKFYYFYHPITGRSHSCIKSLVDRPRKTFDAET